MEWYAVRSKTNLYCPPPAIALTGNQLMDMLRRSVDKSKMVAESPWGLALLMSLEAAFPCNQEKR